MSWRQAFGRGLVRQAEAHASAQGNRRPASGRSSGRGGRGGRMDRGLAFDPLNFSENRQGDFGHHSPA